MAAGYPPGRLIRGSGGSGTANSRCRCCTASSAPWQAIDRGRMLGRTLELQLAPTSSDARWRQPPSDGLVGAVCRFRVPMGRLAPVVQVSQPMIRWKTGSAFVVTPMTYAQCHGVTVLRMQDDRERCP